MTVVADLLTSLDRLDVRLVADGDTLRFDAPRNALTSDLLARLREHKTDLLAILTAPPPFDPALHVHEPDPDDPADSAVLRWMAEGRPMHRPDPPAADFGGPAGWSVKSWCGRLRQLASLCELLHRDIAARYRGEADRIERAVQDSIGIKHE